MTHCGFCAREAVALGYRLDGTKGPFGWGQWKPMCDRCVQEIAHRVKALPAHERAAIEAERAAKREREALLTSARFPGSEEWGRDTRLW